MAPTAGQYRDQVEQLQVPGALRSMSGRASAGPASGARWAAALPDGCAARPGAWPRMWPRGRAPAAPERRLESRARVAASRDGELALHAEGVVRRRTGWCDEAGGALGDEVSG